MLRLINYYAKNILFAPRSMWMYFSIFAACAGVLLYSLPQSDVLLLGALGIRFDIYPRVFFICGTSVLTASIISTAFHGIHAAPRNSVYVLHYSRLSTASIVTASVFFIMLQSTVLTSFTIGPVYTAAALSGIPMQKVYAAVVFIFSLSVLCGLAALLVTHLPSSIRGGIHISLWVGACMYIYAVVSEADFPDLLMLFLIAHAGLIIGLSAAVFLLSTTARRRIVHERN